MATTEGSFANKMYMFGKFERDLLMVSVSSKPET
jgi:hypothetical protein